MKQLREKLKQVVRGSTINSAAETPVPPAAPVPQPGVFLSQLNALSTPRNIRTRRLAQAQENPEMTKTARLAYIFRHLFNAVAQAKGKFHLVIKIICCFLHFEVIEVYFSKILLVH